MIVNMLHRRHLPFELLNGPLAILNILANLFFAFCLACPSVPRDEIKQPLKTLLWSMICCTTIFLLTLVVEEIFWRLNSIYTCYLDEVVSFTASISMSTTVWLNFFYYTQIVPSKEVIFTYVKKNIKIILYSVLFVDRVFFLLDISIKIVAEPKGYNNSCSLITLTNDTSPGLYYAFQVSSFCKIIYVFLCLCLMVGSSWATSRYLRRHIKSMEHSGSPFSCPNLRNQVRVTVTGIMQGIFYFLCALWTFAEFICNHYSSVTFGYNVFYTVISLYMLGTTVNLGIGQFVFRQRAADIGLKVRLAIRPLPLGD
uniref:Taste receptor type 2 n=1 Tax=Esox lucius TaxID=8010 RepID=A0A6Q2ZIH5_ESOLU